MAELTPMMKQYFDIKEQTEDCILFFRLGDFYEMFGDDARLASKELDLTLTTRDRAKENPEDKTPMCGVPYHSSEAYIARLVAKGYKVAICEQTEDPALAKGLVSRDVVRIITPGTVIDSSMLDEGKSNYLCSVYMDGGGGGGAVCFADISTGEVCATDFKGDGASAHIQNELGRFLPSEAVLSEGAAMDKELVGFFANRISCMFRQGGATRFDPQTAREAFARQFGQDALPESAALLCAVGGLLSYLRETQKTDLSHMNAINIYSGGQFMELDYMTRRNLELTETLRLKEKKGSLLWVLDKTKTSMGGRLLRSWTERPLLNPALIGRRQNAVAELVGESVIRAELMLSLREISDMERLIGRIAYGNMNGRDLVSLAAAAEALPRVKELTAGLKSAKLSEIAHLDGLGDILGLVRSAICDEPPFSVREGGIIRPEYNAEVDRLRGVMQNGRGMVAAIEAKERERTGNKKLKLGYNKVFGYYIDVPRSSSENVPEDYIRKQTLVSNERFITQELKELEETLLTAKDRVGALEYELFSEVCAAVAKEADRIRKTAAAIAELDVYCSLAEAAAKGGYCMPAVDYSSVIEIRDGRHPVVEKMTEAGLFVPNDAFLDDGDNRVAIITGPNMAGKSTYMRQIALIALMAQIGSFVPAKSARIGVVDRIFTRIGASDDLAAGRSTFMTEMTEVAEILKNATKKSLLVLDEIGRGTSTFDGMAIARAVLEFCADRRLLGAKTLFATHYHELCELENELAGVKNYNVSVKKRGDDIIFLRKITPGGADRSYGIEVAKLAGVPDRVINRAKDVLAGMERPAERTAAAAPRGGAQLSLADMGGSEIADRLQALDLNTLTPIEAMNLLFELKRLL